MNSCSQHVGSQFPDQGPDPGRLHWEHTVLAAGPPGKSQQPFKTFPTTVGLPQSYLKTGWEAALELWDDGLPTLPCPAWPDAQ